MNLIKRFTDNYNKSESSNIGKLMGILSFESDRVKTVFKTIADYRRIDTATGVTLDNISKNILWDRDGMDDVMYRLFLKTKIRANLSGGQIETINDVLDIILGDHYIGTREVWNDESYNYEPAAIEIRYRNFFDEIKDMYKDNVNDLWYFNGLYAFDGEREFDGGYYFTFTEFAQKILDAMIQTKKMVNFIKAAGVRAWWCEPIEITDATLTTAGINLISGLGAFPTISQIGFGTDGHDIGTGDPLTIDPTTTIVPGEVVRKDVSSFTNGESVLITGVLGFLEGNGYTISSVGIYDGDGILVALKNISPSPKTDDTRLEIKWTQTE